MILKDWGITLMTVVGCPVVELYNSKEDKHLEIDVTLNDLKMLSEELDEEIMELPF